MTVPVKKAALTKITIKGFKSIESLVDFELRPLNVLIGANGAGKSNFVEFFLMLGAMALEGLQEYILKNGGADGFFYSGPKLTDRIIARLDFDESAYDFTLSPAVNGGMVIVRESIETGQASQTLRKLGGEGRFESALSLLTFLEGAKRPDIYEFINDITVYHFHDTTKLAPMRRYQPAYDKKFLREDASNIAAFLFHLREKNRGSYDLIRDTVRLIAPFFDDFILEPESFGPEEKLKLAWRQKGSDFPFQPFHLSDGTIRFICLATALLQPDLPAMIAIDEPELGLHPFAIGMLAGLIQSAAEQTQLIITTQSPALLAYFKPEDVVVVGREQGHSTFARQNPSELARWLDDYSIADLYEMDVLRAGPTHE